ncbi:MAG: hypothetical protein ABJO67_11100 [Pseudoruegeria sp.]
MPSDLNLAVLKTGLVSRGDLFSVQLEAQYYPNFDEGMLPMSRHGTESSVELLIANFEILTGTGLLHPAYQQTGVFKTVASVRVAQSSLKGRERTSSTEKVQE